MSFKIPKYKERLLKQSPKRLYFLASKHKKRLKFAESKIAKEPNWAFLYIIDFIKHPWPEAEPYIINDPHWAYMYARHILKKRWTEAEPLIKNRDLRKWADYKKHFNIKD